MIKKLLGRLTDTTKRKRSAAKRQRGLAFEQMENRLALSTTTGAEIDLQIYSITTTQGGSIELDTVTTNQYYLLDLKGTHFQFAEFGGPSALAHGLAVAGAYEFSGNADSIVLTSAFVSSLQTRQKITIAQPLFGNVANSNGIVAIGAIFENQPLAKGPQESTVNVVVARNQVAPELAPAVVPVNEVSLARGREMYFDVAEVSGDESNSRQVHEKDQATLTRVSFNSLGSEREQVRTASATTVPTSNAAKALKVRGPQIDAIRASAPTLNAVPTVSEAELPALPQESSPQSEKVSATSARDQAFADWRRREFLDSEEILSARTDVSDEDSSSWPVLAALAVGGLVVRSRRMAGSGLWHQQPPRRKKSAIL